MYSKMAAKRILQVVFTAAPILAGIDKFANLMADWTIYIGPNIARMLPVTPDIMMKAIGIVEILAGGMVAFRPRVGALLVFVWLMTVTVILLIGGFYAIALRDFGLAMAALSLSFLSE
jgi:hypothetical protein